MTFGFSGYERGMTPAQRVVVRGLFLNLGLTILHFGDCIGADKEAFEFAYELSAWTVSHPPEDPKKRAFCPANQILPVYPYLIRNEHIARDGCDGLIAAPENAKEYVRGSGTWSTVRRARKHGRRIWLVYPDGSQETEAARV